MTNSRNRLAWVRRLFRRSTNLKPVAAERSILTKVLSHLTLRIAADWVNGLIGNPWKDLDQYL